MSDIAGVPDMPASLPKSGMYHFEQLVGEWPTRFHLRVDPDGGGVLLANASEAASLSPVGVLMAHAILQGESDEAIAMAIRLEFGNAPEAQVTADLAAVHNLIADLASPGDNYPISNLGQGESDWQRQLAAPMRADIDQTEPEVARRIMRKLWDAGVCHVTIITQPERDPAELVPIVEAAEDMDMICGVRAVAGWLSPELIEQMAMAGLDHLNLANLNATAELHDSFIGEGDYAKVVAAFKQCHELELCPVAQVPLMDHNADYIEEICEALAEMDVSNVIFWALVCPDGDTAADEAGALSARMMLQVVVSIEEAADNSNGRYLWAPPVRFDVSQNLTQQIMAGPRTDGDIAVRVDAAGEVYPPRGPKISAGNILNDSWDSIWGHECFTRYREILQEPPACPDCRDLTICQADCPKEPRSWSDDTQGGDSQC